MLSTSTRLSACFRTIYTRSIRCISYVQGQAPEPNSKVREYFYYIDHQGQLFLDDTKVKNFITCFKEKKFLAFFFKRLKVNSTDRYSGDFPYLSPCGVERNYIRCDDRPIVFTQILDDANLNKEQTKDDHEETDCTDRLSCNFADEKFTVKMEPEKICMLPQSGRIYHPAPDKTGGVGLIKSSVAIDISRYFEFGEAGEYAPPTHLNWKGKRYTLTNELIESMTDEERGEIEAPV